MAQIVSAYPILFSYRMLMCVAFVALITLINLRGVRESGAAFAIPSYFFIVIMFIMLGTGFFRVFTGSLGTVVNPPEIKHFGEALSGVTAFLLLHAFSSGTAALTGVEAISNGITAFKEPRSRNVGIILIWMEPDDTEKVRKKWETWGRGNRLVIVDSPYRLFLEPLLDYIHDILASRQPNETITIVVPHFVPTKKIHNVLHMQTAEMPRTAFHAGRDHYRSALSDSLGKSPFLRIGL